MSINVLKAYFQAALEIKKEFWGEIIDDRKGGLIFLC